MPTNVAHDAKVAAAKTAFVSAAMRALPRGAVQSLFSVGPEGVVNWVKRWRVDAPCMVEYVNELRAAADTTAEGQEFKRTIRNRDLTIDRAFGFQSPAEWRTELARLDKLPQSWLRDALADRVAADYILTLLLTASCSIARGRAEALGGFRGDSDAEP
jgi:hypothetical protein